MLLDGRTLPTPKILHDPHIFLFTLDMIWVGAWICSGVFSTLVFDGEMTWQLGSMLARSDALVLFPQAAIQQVHSRASSGSSALQQIN
jgi:hypothetical protein